MLSFTVNLEFSKLQNAFEGEGQIKMLSQKQRQRDSITSAPTLEQKVNAPPGKGAGGSTAHGMCVRINKMPFPLNSWKASWQIIIKKDDRVGISPCAPLSEWGGPGARNLRLFTRRRDTIRNDVPPAVWPNTEHHLLKGIKLESDPVSGSSSQYAESRKTEEHVENAISKIQTVGKSTSQRNQASPQIMAQSRKN